MRQGNRLAGAALIGGLLSAGGSAAAQQTGTEGPRCERHQLAVADCGKTIAEAVRAGPVRALAAYRVCSRAVTGVLYDCTEQRDVACGADILATVFSCQAAKVGFLISRRSANWPMALGSAALAIDCVRGTAGLFENGCLRWPSEREPGYRFGPTAIPGGSPPTRGTAPPGPGVGRPVTPSVEHVPSVSSMYRFEPLAVSARSTTSPGPLQTSLVAMIALASRNSRAETVVTRPVTENELGRVLTRLRALRPAPPKTIRHIVDRFAELHQQASRGTTTAKLRFTRPGKSSASILPTPPEKAK